MFRPLIAFAAAAGVLTAPALAQQSSPGVGNPAATPPGTAATPSGMPAANQPNDADRAFVHGLALGGLAEVAAGKVADQRAQAPAVRQFAQRMVQDHTKANEQLASLARAAGLSAPEELDRDRRAREAELEKLQGSAFDEAYIRGQITAHQQAVQLLTFQIGSGQDPALKQFATEALPVVTTHLRMAQMLAAETMGAASRELPPRADAGRATPAPSTGGQGEAH